MDTQPNFNPNGAVMRAVAVFSFVFMAGISNAQPKNKPAAAPAANPTPPAPTLTQTAGPTLTPTDPASSETFYLKENTRNRKVVPYTPEREADMEWSKRVWRTIDLREKFNLPMYYPEMPLNGRKSLFDVLKEGIKAGKIYAYDNPAFDDEFKVRIQMSAVAEMFDWVDTTNMVEDPNKPGTWIKAPIPYSLTAKDIKQYWVKEDWYFDKQRSVQDVRIIGLCPLKEKIDPTDGSIIGYVPLFWVYFPQCRPFLSNAEVFNTKNDAQRISYDDLFMKRQFQSFVRKESNVYDRSIGDYTTGIDALLEADRVKDDIFKQEHDMWHF